MPSVRDMLFEGAHALPGDEGRREAALLLRHVLRVSDTWLVAHADASVATPAATAYRALIERRAAGEPVAYIIGMRGFHALELCVTPDVLIPRPETELLVDCVLQRLPDAATCRVADLGTGSGALALAIAHARPYARVVATDVSAAALQVARSNAERLGLGSVEFAQGDWCAALGSARFDVIASNPPYIATGDDHLRRGDLRFEPALALAAGADGLDAIRSIVQAAPAHLVARGWLLFEHGFGQGPAVRKLLQGSGYAGVFTQRDFGGRERVSGGQVGGPA